MNKKGYNVADYIIPFLVGSGITAWVCIIAKLGLMLGNLIGSVLVKLHYKRHPIADFKDERVPF